MNSAIERLISLRVADLMTTDVVRVPAHETMAEAAKALTRFGVNGAPVVDDQGRCVGVLSGFDYIAREQAQEATEKSSTGSVEHVLVQERAGGPYHIEDMAEDLVSSHMTTAVRTVAETATLIEAARAMCAEHIHRLVVLDKQDRPKGVVSSLDIVAAMVKAIEE